MKTVRTVVCKLAPTSEQAADIDATLEAFAAACDFAVDVARRIGSTNKVQVQHAAYRQRPGGQEAPKTRRGGDAPRVVGLRACPAC